MDSWQRRVGSMEDAVQQASEWALLMASYAANSAIVHAVYRYLVPCSQQEEEDLLGNKRKWDKTGFYPYESDEDEPYEYESGDDVVEGNVESFKEKEVLKIKVQGPAKYYNWRNKKYRCPYGSKPKPRFGLLEHLMEHCRATSISSHDYKIIGQHSALLKVLRNPDL
ncbi:uncharacterized protein LOC119296886 [Triticum dicoccoides]|uniref:uncharacterized protein LOC119296886 n=1 Tax=Triticum dicoccoides TaxID=85692 RepID=UPI00188EEA1B|nr:uncharacterized protein LOC119296886 [Triticum dicoccoides]